EKNTTDKPWNVALHQYGEKIDSNIYNKINNARCVVTLKPIDMLQLVKLIRGEKMDNGEDAKSFAHKIIGEKQ
ncbi:MAG: hypothetical protein FWH27_09370, partial [Planctomycetaceae bacterium]|nr:hypothetical protein [Planctomycetaceae bacterium]